MKLNSLVVQIFIKFCLNHLENEEKLRFFVSGLKCLFKSLNNYKEQMFFTQSSLSFFFVKLIKTLLVAEIFIKFKMIKPFLGIKKN
jgi:hypothetical protein